jgi:hypothetical protein
MGVPVRENEVYIHDTYFPIVGPVRRVNFAVTPNPVLFGDTTKASDSVAMTQLTQVDYSGGSGVHLGNTRTDVNRCWTSDLATHHHRGVCLPPLPIDLGVPGWAAAGSNPRTLADFTGKLWVSFNNKVGTYDPAVPGWAGAADRTLGSSAMQVLVWQDKIFYCCFTTAYEYRTTAGVWAIGGFNPVSMTAWDNKLWAIGINGPLVTLYRSLDGVTWTSTAAIVPENARSQIVKLDVWRDSTGATALYAHSDKGLWIYDATFDRFLPTEVQYSPALTTDDLLIGKQGPDGRYYTTNGKAGLIAVQTGNPMVITPVGLDRDDGLPTSDSFGTTIAALEKDENFIYAMTVATVPETIRIRAYRGGWHTLATHPLMHGNIPDMAGYPMLVSTIGAKCLFYAFQTRVPAGSEPKVFAIQLATGVFNPRFLSEPGGYAAGPLTLVTPWWPFESEVQRKIFGHIFVQAKNHTATETTKIEVAIDLDDSTWFLVTGAYGDANPITSDGLKEFYSQIQGAQVRWIRYRFTQQRGGTTSLTPIMEFYTAEMMRVLGPTYAYSVEVDLSKPHRKKTPEALRLRIEQLLDPDVVAGFYKFSWQDELEGVRTHYGRLSREAGMGYTGPGMRGQGRETLSIIIPYHRDVS